jgi:hypothetical protein
VPPFPSLTSGRSIISMPALRFLTICRTRFCLFWAAPSLLQPAVVSSPWGRDIRHSSFGALT